ncbi:hypothetical protein AG1IA_09230 [Rhizoctonia solani AG-1 IA]|uniref:Uncharacterized protein n=1 Tax=Thanatephorus cucumeris (strain AG1-IA) TaxID=983506 RepID=L8WIV6_THACA|nr:hypothetical protein AG1IA_09230 [Rhizoctonia solani AG-1 IA]
MLRGTSSRFWTCTSGRGNGILNCPITFGWCGAGTRWASLNLRGSDEGEMGEGRDEPGSRGRTRSVHDQGVSESSGSDSSPSSDPLDGWTRGLVGDPLRVALEPRRERGRETSELTLRKLPASGIPRLSASPRLTTLGALSSPNNN